MIKNSRICGTRVYISFTSHSSEFEATLNANGALTKKTINSIYHTLQISEFDATINANVKEF